MTFDAIIEEKDCFVSGREREETIQKVNIENVGDFNPVCLEK